MDEAQAESEPTPVDPAPGGLRSYVSARALVLTALRGLLLGGALVVFMFLDAEARREAGGDLLLLSGILVVGVSIALAPSSLVELRRTVTGVAPSRGALLAGWALGGLALLLAITQAIYAVAVLEARSLDAGLEALIEFARMMRGSTEDLLVLLVVTVLFPSVFALLSAIRLERLSRGMRTTFLVLTFPSGLVALGVYGLVDVLDRLLFSRGARRSVGERAAPEPTGDASA